MRQAKRVTRKRTILRLRASADEWERPRGIAEWPGYSRRAKKQVSLLLDADVLAWFKREGPGYQTRINRVLRSLVKEEKRKSGE